jgi:hypothetical protein
MVMENGDGDHATALYTQWFVCDFVGMLTKRSIVFLEKKEQSALVGLSDRRHRSRQ